ncbi:hypothetical protein M8C21_000114, partial [Ambrosia artemisiifolia]
MPLFSLIGMLYSDNQVPLIIISGSRRIAESFDGLRNHLRDMMQGYENEEVQALLEEMEELTSVMPLQGEEAVVGFDDEVEILLDQLTGTCTKRLQIISIAGMAGLGKTTLAKKLYTDPLIEYMFDFRAWTCVS